MTVITGVSGSGKSSLAFETLFAEGQRRYIETFSPYARQFFDRMDKPQVDRIEGIPPAIAIEQKNTVKSPRSTVGTMTEICDYVKILWSHFARPFCKRCGRPVVADSPQSVWRFLQENEIQGKLIYVAFHVQISAALGQAECLRAILSQGFQRCLLGNRVRRIADWIAEEAGQNQNSKDNAGAEEWKSLLVVQDRIRLTPRARPRFVEACEQAFSFGKKRLSLFVESENSELKALRSFSRLTECAQCGETLPKPTRSFFSFNSPVGACPQCRGSGRLLAVDYWAAIPDPSMTLAEGAVKPWQIGHGLRSQMDLMQAARRDSVPTNVPFGRLSPDQQKWVIFGDPNYGKDRRHRWPESWYGVKGYFDWLESKAYKMHLRVMLARYRAQRECPACNGARFKPEVLQFLVECRARKFRLTLPEFYALPIQDALKIVNEWHRRIKIRRNSPLRHALREVQSRLQFLADVGLSYLTLDRPTNTLSGGETERINLTSCLGTRLVNTLFVLDEPSVGLHAVDVQNLIRILHRLRDAGNTLVVVEHDAEIIRSADRVIDIGPGSGADGGRLIFAGTVPSLSRRRNFATARFLSGREKLGSGLPSRPVGKDAQWLSIRNATCRNLSRLSVDIPLNRLVCVAGVSGSGKTTLIKQVLAPALSRAVNLSSPHSPPHADAEARGLNPTGDSGRENSTLAELGGFESLDSVILVDQSPIGKTPRSSPALYVGIFEDIRKLFAASKSAITAGWTPGTFSFNSPSGQCERCRGAGFEKVEMQFLSDVFLRCPECDGDRYCRKVRDFALDLSEFTPADSEFFGKSQWTAPAMLKTTADEAVEILRQCSSHIAARKAVRGLRWLQEVGLGYLQLGQPVNTLSGGESQRLKVARHLYAGGNAEKVSKPENRCPRESRNKTLFLFDEPTTGLHFVDVNVLLRVFRTMIQNGHSVIVIEHHIEFIQQADWVIDMGPGAGAEGGRIVDQGHPTAIARSKQSLTGKFLRAGKTNKNPQI